MELTQKNLFITFLLLILGFSSHPGQAGSGSIDHTSSTPPPLCTQIENGLPDGLTLPGMMILEWKNKYSGQESNPTIFSPATHQMKWVINPNNADLQDISVSPDLKWVAYIEDLSDRKGHDRTRTLRVINAQQKQLKFDWILDWQSIIGWINYHQIALSTPGQDTGTVTILDPFTGVWQKFNPGFPDPLKIGMDVFQDPYTLRSKEFYSPDLDRVVYKADSQKLTLWDIPNKKILWDTEMVSTTIPIWSPDGKGFIELLSNSIVAYIDRTGKWKELYKTKDDFHLYSRSRSAPFSWSPDSKNIAFWDAMDSEIKLIILGLSSGKITESCVSNQYDYGYTPVWSPDSRFLLSMVDDENYSWDDPILNYTVIIDTLEHRAYKILPNSVPVGWLANP